MPPTELFQALARVRHYDRARFEILDLPLTEALRVSQARVKEFKLLQVADLIDELAVSHLELFTPCRYRLPGDSTSVITPPVVETTSRGLVMIEGHTRAFYAARQGMTHLKVIVAHDVKSALPVEPRPFTDLRLAHETIESAANMPGNNPSLMRNIENALHP
ncbi:hypothetical protein DYI24_13245 [Rhodopseudomonas sp. BR0C11]|uniref:hypothetical protein n=1 Tax=Rhodopseudomonas sp. BR0C11 TaxID=2269370 RepID=UPI0013DF80D0|nr:hypothetical protein [Rhodopseudomonas sp. BR0C11]NEV78003.1 hypothetical protein [Rhodopseudomonas sp. BR0C11]